MIEVVHKADVVYGVGRDLPLNYVTRPRVDNVLVENLTRDKHVVVYGSSKQGKTSLRKQWLNDDENVVVSCLNTMTLSDLHGAILKRVGYRIEQSQSRTVTGAFKVNAEFKGKGKVPLVAELSAGATVDGQQSSSNTKTHVRLELDLGDVNDIVAALEEIDFRQYIVLEDFHYLPVDTQRNFAFSLKSFHENSSICFIVIGVWREKNRLVYYNGDLAGRVVSVDADDWNEQELEEVIAAGETLMNVSFDADFRQSVIENAFDTVYLVQEACLLACHEAGVYQTTDKHRVVGAGLDAKELIRKVVNGQAGRYSAFIQNFAEGFQKTELDMYKWLLRAVISSDIAALEKGLRRSEISASIKANHPEGNSLNEGNITQALQNAASLQVSKSVRPIIIDYDQTSKTLNVVDRSFLIWLAYQDRDELLAEL